MINAFYCIAYEKDGCAMHLDCIAYVKHNCANYWDCIAYDKHNGAIHWDCITIVVHCIGNALLMISIMINALYCIA